MNVTVTSPLSTDFCSLNLSFVLPIVYLLSQCHEHPTNSSQSTPTPFTVPTPANCTTTGPTNTSAPCARACPNTEGLSLCAPAVPAAWGLCHLPARQDHGCHRHRHRRHQHYRHRHRHYRHRYRNLRVIFSTVFFFVWSVGFFFLLKLWKTKLKIDVGYF